MQKNGSGGREIKTPCSVLLFLGFFAFSACIAAEFKRAKVKDMRVAGKLCSLPGTPAFGLGIFSIICLAGAHIIGNLVICTHLRSHKEAAPKRTTLGITFLLLSWVSFVLGVIILGGATSMNRKQHYREGWLKGECYVVKDGVYLGASALLLSTVFFLIASIFATRLRNRGGEVTSDREQGRKVHADHKRSLTYKSEESPSPSL
ncbi:hypothetical protein Scep_027184 [Stephania cephalantha]|uniref:Uncharacterized protein n=1 Tax=Stephania cephalantha TaxID=152367 RepID=A0AAP0HTX5_9MAGN